MKVPKAWKSSSASFVGSSVELEKGHTSWATFTFTLVFGALHNATRLDLNERKCTENTFCSYSLSTVCCCRVNRQCKKVVSGPLDSVKAQSGALLTKPLVRVYPSFAKQTRHFSSATNHQRDTNEEEGGKVARSTVCEMFRLEISAWGYVKLNAF